MMGSNWRLAWSAKANTTDDPVPPASARFKDIVRINRKPYPEYQASSQIIEAVNTAVSLGKPLLVSGEPGVGKTQLAYFIAREFGLIDGKGNPEVFRFDVKSDTKGADLIYRYDAIRHFRDSNLKTSPQKDHWDETASNAVSPEPREPSILYRDYVELKELGIGIALGNGRYHDYGNEDLNAIVKDALDGVGDADAPRVSVVLIDEIDKAPRDVPNDLLREIDEMTGYIPELGRRAVLTAPGFDKRPIVIITTNDERALPDAFLRRCCFLHIGFPDIESEEGREAIVDIVKKRLGQDWRDEGLAGAAITLVNQIRNESRFSKKPTTAELIDFIREAHDRIKIELERDDDKRAAGDINFLDEKSDSIRAAAKSTAITVFAKSADDDAIIGKLIPDPAASDD